MTSRFLQVAIALTIALTAYTTRLVCNEPRFDDISTILKTVRRYGGCVPLDDLVKRTREEALTRARNAQESAPKPKETPQHKADKAPDKMDFFRDNKGHISVRGAPAWARVVAELEIEEWPDSFGELAGSQIAKKRVPRIFYKTPITPLKDIDASFEQAEDEFWKAELEFIARPGNVPMFRSAPIPNLTMPFVPAMVTRRTITNFEMFSRGILDGSESFTSEERIAEISTFVSGSQDQFTVHRNESDESNVFSNETVTRTLVVESPGSILAPVQTHANLFLMQNLGKRLVLLFPPEVSTRMAFYPRFSPRRRQSILDVVSAIKDDDRLPCLAVILDAGEVLYVPPMWAYRTVVVGPESGKSSASHFSFSVTSSSSSMEQDFMDFTQQHLKFMDVLMIVQQMQETATELSNLTHRASASSAFIVVNLLQDMGIDPKTWIAALLERIDGAIADMPFVPRTESACVGPSKFKFLSKKAKDILAGYTGVLADGERVLVEMYSKRLDSRFGSVEVRARGVWQIFAQEWVENFAFTMSGGDPYTFLWCILNELSGNSAPPQAQSI